MNGERAMMINGKGANITRDDLMAVGVQAGLSQCVARTVFDEVEAGVLDEAKR